MKPTLYLDYDGVLHPHAVFITESGNAHLRHPFEYHELFEHAPALESILSEFPDLNIVLSTTWARELGLAKSIEQLPATIRHQVSDATWNESTLATLDIDVVSRPRPMEHHSVLRDWRAHSRFAQIQAHAQANGITQWVALDDDSRGWPNEERTRLVRCDEGLGLGEAATQDALRETIRALLRGDIETDY